MPQIIIDIGEGFALTIKGEGMSIHQVVTFLGLALTHVQQQVLMQGLSQILTNAKQGNVIEPQIVLPHDLPNPNIRRRG